LVIDPGHQLGPFASIAVGDRERIEFVPDIVVTGNNGRPLDSVLNGRQIGFVVLLTAADELPAAGPDALHLLVRRQSLYVVPCVTRQSLAPCRAKTDGLMAQLRPDVVVFDESFVNHDVPFGAFTARKELYGYWNRRGKTAFHSTTFQPNTVASLHFLRCL